MQALSPIENIKIEFENYLKREHCVLTPGECADLDHYGGNDVADLFSNGTANTAYFYSSMIEYVKQFHNKGPDYRGQHNVALYYYEHLITEWVPLQEGAGHAGGVVAFEFAEVQFGQQGSGNNREIIMNPGSVNALIIELAAYAVLENRPIILDHLRYRIKDRNRSSILRRYILDPLYRWTNHFNRVSIEGSFEYLLEAKVAELRLNESKPAPQMSQLQQQYTPQAQITPTNAQLSPPTDPNDHRFQLYDMELH